MTYIQVSVNLALHKVLDLSTFPGCNVCVGWEGLWVLERWYTLQNWHISAD